MPTTRGAGPVALTLSILVAPVLAGFAVGQGMEADDSEQAWVVEQARRKIRFENDGTGSKETTARVRVNTDGGVRQWGVLRLPYNAAVERLEVRRVGVLKPDGHVVEAPLERAMEITAPVATAFPVYSDLREKHVAVPDLRPGDVIEYAVDSTLLSSVAAGQFWYEYSFSPTEVSLDDETEIDTPRGRAVTVNSSAAVVRTVLDQGDRRVYRFAYKRTAADTASAKGKPFLGWLQSGPPDIELSTVSSWPEIGAWWAGLERPGRAPTPEIQARAEALTQGLSDDLQKVEAIYHYVATSIRYVSISLGSGAVKPHPAPETLSNGYGDCKDKHTLLAALLGTLGIPVHAVLINSWRSADPKVPYLQFDHVISVVPVGKEYLWMDTTTEIAPFGWLSPNLRGKQALMIPPEGAAHLVTTPEGSSVPNETVCELAGTVDSTGKLAAHVRERYRGDLEVPVRLAARLLTRDQFRTALQTAQALGRKAEISDLRLGDPVSTREPFAVDIDYAVSEFVDWSKKRPNFKIAYGSKPVLDVSQIPSDPEGFLPLGGPATIRHASKLEIPAGWSVRPPDDASFSDDFADFHSHYAFAAGMVTGERVLTMKVRELPEARRADLERFMSLVNAEAQRDFELQSESAASTQATHVEAETLYRSGIDAMRKADFEQAATSLRRVVDLDPAYPEAWATLGRCYAAQGLVDQAIAAFQKQVEVAPAHASAYGDLGAGLIMARRYGEAETALRKQLEVDPQNAAAPYRLGVVYVQQGKFQDALAILVKASTSDPTNADAQARIGQAYLGLGRDAEGLAALELAVKLASAPGIWNNAAYILAEAGKHLDRAQEWAESAVTTLVIRLRTIATTNLGVADALASRQLAMYWDTLGWVLFKRGDFDGAKRYLEAGLALWPQVPVADHLGQLLQSRGERDGASHAYALALALAEPTSELRARLVALVGNEAEADAAVDKARLELAEERSQKVPRPAGISRAGVAEFVVALGTGRGLTGATFLSGSPEMAPAASSLIGTQTHFPFPDSTSTQIVQRARLSCSESGDCQLALRGLERSDARQRSAPSPP